MPILYLDIEAIRNPSNPGKDRDDGGLQAAPHWLVVAACAIVMVERTIQPEPELGCDRPQSIVWLEATRAVTFGRGSTDERAILAHIAEALARRPSLRTWSGDGFDLPVLRAAMMAHGIQCPWLFHNEVTNRYRDGHRDLMDELCNRGGAPRWSLSGTAVRMGLPGKLDVDGSQVAELFAAGRHEEIQAYCLQDCWQLAAIDVRLELSSGRLTPDGYRMSAASLADLAGKTPALAPILGHERFDRKRFLLEAA